MMSSKEAVVCLLEAPMDVKQGYGTGSIEEPMKNLQLRVRDYRGMASEITVYHYRGFNPGPLEQGRNPNIRGGLVAAGDIPQMR